MRLWLGRIFVCAFNVLLCASCSVGADLASGKRAYEEKDYATALKELTPLAEQGNSDAQVILGRMYWMGQGVLQDTSQAIKWFEPSAKGATPMLNSSWALIICCPAGTSLKE